jgi:ribonuclease R
LIDLQSEGHPEKRHKTYRDPSKLPPVSVLRVGPPDADGDMFASPAEWQGDGPEPRIVMLLKSSEPALGEGERILARLTEITDDNIDYEARLIRRIGTNPQRILGVFRAGSGGGRIVPIDKGADKEWRVSAAASYGAKDGELVEAEQAGPKGRMGLPAARIINRLGDPTAPKAASLIAIHQHAIPDVFPDDVIAEADSAVPAELGKREDLLHLQLITIDPADARDHDDAIYAHVDDDPNNEGGHVVWVAIADVAFYVSPGSALDREAHQRGNSTYFPDRVVPMLPDRLSGDLCSLHEGVPRACLAVRMVLNAGGQKISHKFVRGFMTSAASLNYVEVQSARDGMTNDKTAPLMADVIDPLYEAYAVATKARAVRQPLELDLPERKIILSEEGHVTSVAFRDRLDAHKLIEEFMILANVAAAEELIAKKQPLLFRVHEEPSPEKMESLREVALASGFNLAKGQVLQTQHFNRLLGQAAGTEFDELINLSTLRSMTQAYYNAENFGHFGLALKSYAHFTSPIRRYADLMVHRALISGHGWGDDGMSVEDIDHLDETAVQISETERRSMAAERDTTDRYLASYLTDCVGNEFEGRISGVTRFGVFVKLDETGADGLIPIRTLGREFFEHDPNTNTLTGTDTGVTIGLGQRVTVRLAEAVALTGGLRLELLALDGNTLPRGPSRGRGKPMARRSSKSRKKAAKTKRKVARKRR